MKLGLRSLVIAILVAACTSLFAQMATSSLRGTVADSQGAIVVGASVTLDRRETGFHSVYTTEKDGSFQFQQVPPGLYTLTVRTPTFATEITNVQLLVAQPSTVNMTLAPLSSSESVYVNANAALALNTTNASIGNAVDEQTVHALPMEGRNVPDLLSLQPGVLYLGHNVNQDNDSRSGAVAGARSDQGNVTLDGLDNNNQVKGYAFTGVLRSTLDSVEEFRVTTTNNGVDSGRSSGAQVNVVTRGGTNTIHGDLYEYNRNTSTSANNWFNKQAESISGEPNHPGELIRNTFGAALGGPIKKDKLYYFANFEMQRTAEAQEETLVVPNASFRAGNISYPYTNGDNQQSTFTLTPTAFAQLDPHCSAIGTCPWGPGVDPNILTVFKSYPLPNGSLSGDGYNTGSYTWAAPNPITLWTNIAKVDYTLSDRHSLFFRGDLQDDGIASPPQFPGQVPSNRTRDNTKGFAVGEVWTVNQNLVNNFRFGFSRQGYSNRGAASQPFVTLASVSNPVAETFSTLVKVPTINVVDDVSWTKGKHTFQFGLDYRNIHDETSTNAYSFDSASSYNSEYDGSIANTGQDLDPSAYPELGFPSVASSFNNSYSYAAMNLAGIVAATSLNYVYNVTPQKTAALLPEGSFVGRNFKMNQFDYYLQDTFQVMPKLTITFGIRHSLSQTPYEVNGQQVSPDISLNKWFQTRADDAKLGESVQPNYNFILSGQANNAKAMWAMQKWNIAPRIGVAYALDSKTSIRAGGGLNYDNFGLSVANAVATQGSFGLLGSEQTLAGYASIQALPRFTGLNNIPLTASGLLPPASTTSFPFVAPIGGEAYGFFVDDGIKTPHSFQADLSIQRELPGGFTLETDYVGRFGRRTLQNRDLGMPLDLVDPSSGLDYFRAVDMLETQAYSGTATKDVKPIPYWENLFPDAAGSGAVGTGTIGNTATQNIYNHFAADPLNASYGLFAMDILCDPGCGSQHNRYFASQFSSMQTLSSIGTTSYNALQVILRHAMRNGLQADFNYTYSKSIDLGSDTERVGNSAQNAGSNTGYSTFSQIINPFNPKLNRAVSDFDTRHLLSLDWVYELPFGHGRAFASNANGLIERAIGGWQFTGLARVTSGLPFGDQVGGGWVTSWGYQSFLVKQGHVAMHKHIIPGVGPEVFADPDSLQANIGSPNSPIRLPLPGEAGSRNAFRGDGFFGIDSGLNKSWHLKGGSSLKFGWEVFNVTNTPRFDTNPNFSLQSVFGNGHFGVYSSTLSQARVQQFSLRLTH